MIRESRQGRSDCRDATGDDLDAATPRRVLDRDAVAWLAGQGIRYLHAANADEEMSFKRTVELLQRMPGATAAIAQAFHETSREDHSLRWALLYLLAEVGDASAAEIFFKAAAEPVPSRDRYPQGCETPRDGEVLVRTMAIAGLARTVPDNKDATELLYKLLAAQPERALRIETVKALMALDPRAAGRIKETLPKELHFVTDLTKVRAEALAVEHETKTIDKARLAPQLGAKPSSPRSSCCRCP
ncbi:MAG TPA: hypothetical protein VEX43_03450 [Chthoniobacterales bacterium]|nr:hypothetical protein [Chthoniobacterales bacterium]